MSFENENSSLWAILVSSYTYDKNQPFWVNMLSYLVLSVIALVALGLIIIAVGVIVLLGWGFIVDLFIPFVSFVWKLIQFISNSTKDVFAQFQLQQRMQRLFIQVIGVQAVVAILLLTVGRFMKERK